MRLAAAVTPTPFREFSVKSLIVSFSLAAALLAGPTTPARAVVHYGQTAPDFMKTQYNSAPPVIQTLNSYPFKVRIFFLFGYDCPFCLNDGPSFETNINLYYRNARPDAVQCVGFDLYNGTPAAVGSFQAQTGASYPLALNGAAPAGGNLSTLYGPFDNYVVVDRFGIVRYHAADRWPHGNRYHLNELRAVVDSLLAAQTGVDEAPPAPIELLTLAVTPNPFSSATRIELLNAGTAVLPAQVDVVDALGRRVATIYQGMASPGVTHLVWDGGAGSGYRAPSGLYFVRAEVGGRSIVRRVVRSR